MRAILCIALVACAPADAGTPDGATDAPPSAIELGATAFVRRACPDCHMASDGTLSGSTTPVVNTQAYPANLTPDTETGIGVWSVADIARAIRFGIDGVSAAPDWIALCPTMQRFDLSMSDEEARDIAVFLKSLAPVKHTIPRSVCPPWRVGDAGGE